MKAVKLNILTAFLFCVTIVKVETSSFLVIV